MKKPLLTSILAALLCSCSTSTPVPSHPSIEGDIVDGRHVLLYMRPGDRTRYKVLESPRRIEQPIISDNGKFISYVSFENGTPALFTQEVALGRRTQVCHLDDSLIQTHFSADSSTLLVLSRGHLYRLPMLGESAAGAARTPKNLPFCSSEPPRTNPPRRRRVQP